MGYKAELSDTMKTAMKSGDKDTLSFARNLHAAVRKREIDDRVELDDMGVSKIAQSLIKQRHESIEQFKAGNRMDLVTREEAELSFLKRFVPAQMAEDELIRLVVETICETQANTPKDMGKVMKALLPKVQGRADGKKVSELVQGKLKGP